jgi:RNA polymerase sigma factor (sigma-70 family)
VRPDILRSCTRDLNDYHLAEDVTQIVGWRASSGYETLRDRQAFRAWVFKIKAREVLRALDKVSRRREILDPGGLVERALESQQQNRDSGRIPGEASEQKLDQVILDAISHAAISQSEAEILQAKTSEQGESWKQIAARLNISPTSCATIHCRAMPKLLHFILEYCPELVGGRERIQRIFQDFVQAPPHLLTPAEAETFRRVIIERDRSYRRRGWRGALRSACNKLARYLIPHL